VALAHSLTTGTAGALTPFSANATHAGVRTSEIVYSVNLPETAPAGRAPMVSRGAILGCDLAAFFASTLPGGSIDIFDPNGRTAHLAWRWGQTGAGGIAPVSVWGLFYRVRRNAAFSEIAWRHTGREYRFTGLRCVESTWPHVLQDITIDGMSCGPLRISHGPGGITLSPDSYNLVRITALSQNGSPAPAEC
jgi:hypothetical protein